MDVHGQMIQKEHVEELLIDDDDFKRDDLNQKYDPLANIESIKTIYSDFVFTSPSIMYDKEAEIASAMTGNGLLMKNRTAIDKSP